MIEVRNAVEIDAALLPDIERSSGEAFRLIPHLAWIADDDVQSVDRHLELIRQGTAWVATLRRGKITGFLSAELRSNSLHIWQMAVHADHQKKGIGRRLIDEAKRWSAIQNLSSLTLTTFRNVPWNEPFYNACGFRKIEGEPSRALQDILDAEVAAGLPKDQRCAMIFHKRKPKWDELTSTSKP